MHATFAVSCVRACHLAQFSRAAAEAHCPAPRAGADAGGPTERWSIDFVHDALSDDTE